jgi:hypothetical protein
METYINTFILLNIVNESNQFSILMQYLSASIAENG